MPTETIHYPDGRWFNIVDLTDSSERVPYNRATEDIMKILIANPNIAKMVYFKLKEHYNNALVA